MSPVLQTLYNGGIARSLSKPITFPTEGHVNPACGDIGIRLIDVYDGEKYLMSGSGLRGWEDLIDFGNRAKISHRIEARSPFSSRMRIFA